MLVELTNYLSIDILPNETWLLMLPAYGLSLTVLLALLLDTCLGEAKKYHYLVGFGWFAQFIENKLNPDLKSVVATPFSYYKAALGGIAWLLLVLPLVLVYWCFLSDLVWYWQILVDAFVLYLAIALNSLNKHAMQVYQPLKLNELQQARHFTGYLVSRETAKLSPAEMSRATVESMLENGHDAVIASMIYYLIGGIPLVIVHRLANTLDAMWGYKTPRYNSFGYVSARLDDALGFISGKACTLLYAMQGRFLLSMKNAYCQGNCYKSHNGGWVMAAGATVMQRTLGGSANYHGKIIKSVTLGQGSAVNIEDIPKSVNVVRRAAFLLFLLIGIVQTLLIFL